MKSILFIFSLLLFGCSGVKFSSVPLTADIPETFKQRNLYPDESGIIKYKLTQLVGSVLYAEPNAKYFDLKKIILKKDYKPYLEVISETDGKVFTGTINKSNNFSASYLSFAASLSSNQLATFSVRDRNIVFIDNNDVPWEALIEEAKITNDNPSRRRYWVQGALLASLDAYKFSEIESDASAVVGPTFGAEGKVYNKGEEEIHDYKISIHLIDLDKLSHFLSNPNITITSFTDSKFVEEISASNVQLLLIRGSDLE